MQHIMQHITKMKNIWKTESTKGQRAFFGGAGKATALEAACTEKGNHGRCPLCHTRAGIPDKLYMTSYYIMPTAKSINKEIGAKGL